MEAIVALTADTFVFVFVIPCVFTFVFLIFPCNLWQVGHLEAELVINARRRQRRGRRAGERTCPICWSVFYTLYYLEILLKFC